MWSDLESDARANRIANTLRLASGKFADNQHVTGREDRLNHTSEQIVMTGIAVEFSRRIPHNTRIVRVALTVAKA